MSIDKNIEQRLEDMFPGVTLDPDIDGMLHIRTDNWQITAEDLSALKQMNLELDHIYTEGGCTITLVITTENPPKYY